MSRADSPMPFPSVDAHRRGQGNPATRIAVDMTAIYMVLSHTTVSGVAGVTMMARSSGKRSLLLLHINGAIDLVHGS